MDIAHAVVFAALEGFTGVLPLSDSGHQLVARIWLGDVHAIKGIQALAELACLLALAIASRRRLGAALSEGIRGITRPAVLQASGGGRDAVALVLAAVVATGTELTLAPFTSPLNAMPVVAGAGLMLSAAALLSTLVAPSPEHTQPTGAGALLVGLMHGLAVVPGASQVGAAFVALRWLGVSSWNAVEMALLVTIPVLGLRSARLLYSGEAHLLGDPALAPGHIALALVVAFVCASLAANWWRALAEKNRTPWLALWLVPLSLAVLAYDRALPEPLNETDRTTRPLMRTAVCRDHERLRGDHGRRIRQTVLARIAQGPAQAAVVPRR
jgi:undecaprenyl-diphosphatase